MKLFHKILLFLGTASLTTPGEFTDFSTEYQSKPVVSVLLSFSMEAQVKVGVISDGKV